MLRVSFLVLFATALAATNAHARLDLIGQLRPNSECQKIPFLLCGLICDACVCDRRVPELAECTCGQWKPYGELQKSEESHRELNLVSETVAKSVGGFIPYPQCIEECDECVICTKIYPIEKALCYCGKKTASNSKKPAIEYAEKLSTELEVVAKPVAKSVGGFIPYPECIEKCDECVICTKNFPIEKQLCYCGKKTASSSRKPAIEYAEKLLKELDVVTKPVAKSVGGFIPYPECIEKCDECVICTLPYPMELALCYCGKKTEAEGRALPI